MALVVTVGMVVIAIVIVVVTMRVMIIVLKVHYSWILLAVNGCHYSATTMSHSCDEPRVFVVFGPNLAIPVTP